jgi:hypothetical protein
MIMVSPKARSIAKILAQPFIGMFGISFMSRDIASPPAIVQLMEIGIEASGETEAKARGKEMSPVTTLASAVLIGLAPLSAYASEQVPDAVMEEIKAACMKTFNLAGFPRDWGRTEEGRQEFYGAVHAAEICSLKSAEMYLQLHGVPYNGHRPWISTDK